MTLNETSRSAKHNLYYILSHLITDWELSETPSHIGDRHFRLLYVRSKLLIHVYTMQEPALHLLVNVLRDFRRHDQGLTFFGRQMNFLGAEYKVSSWFCSHFTWLDDNLSGTSSSNKLLVFLVRLSHFLSFDKNECWHGPRSHFSVCYDTSSNEYSHCLTSSGLNHLHLGDICHLRLSRV